MRLEPRWHNCLPSNLVGWSAVDGQEVADTSIWATSFRCPGHQGVVPGRVGGGVISKNRPPFGGTEPTGCESGGRRSGQRGRKELVRVRRIMAVLVVVALLGVWTCAAAGSYDCNGRTCTETPGMCSFISCCGANGQGCYMMCISHKCVEWTWWPICGWPPCCVEWRTIVDFHCFEGFVPEMRQAIPLE